MSETTTDDLYVDATAEDTEAIDAFLESAPRPDLSRPRHRRFIGTFYESYEKASESGGIAELFDFFADLDEIMESSMGGAWVAWVESIPMRLQDATLLKYVMTLSQDMGKDERSPV